MLHPKRLGCLVTAETGQVREGCVRPIMHRRANLCQGSSLPSIRSENSILGHHGRRHPHAQPSVSRHRDDVQIPDVSEQQLEDDVIINPGRLDSVLPPNSTNYQDRSGVTYRGEFETKMRQPNIASKRSCLPLAEWLLDDLLQDMVHEVTVETIQRCTRGFVDSFLAEVTIRRCAADIISEMVQLLLHGLVEEIQREKAADGVIEAELLPEVLVEEARAVALSEMARCESQLTVQQLSQVRQYASSRLMDVFLMDTLLELVARKPWCFTEKKQSGRLLDKRASSDVALHDDGTPHKLN
ncbi:uncharacterized protein LOC133133288 [Conger conger]|uniref:uncharacterized protein LOC133133288 n=1 Tax=Conger conger TaxID=82655 RepID=UPI002A5A7307|nr:uncharacterized protein LOC133133288 [Conger conger]